eukprot:15327898-Ditylum_brightwellii.AAC.1
MILCPAGQNTTGGCGPVNLLADQGALEGQDESGPVHSNGANIGNKSDESISPIVCNYTPLASTKYFLQQNKWWQHKLLQAMVVDNLEITWDYACDTE